MRSKRSTAGAVILTLMAAMAAANAPDPATPTFPADVELITVDAVVVDGKGRPVKGLSREDFIVKEDGQAQSIATFEAVVLDRPTGGEAASAAAAARRGFALVVDDVSMSIRDAADLRRDLTRFVESSLGPGDQVTFGTTSGRAWWTGELPQGREPLLSSVRAIRGFDVVPIWSPRLLTDHEAMWIQSRAGSGDAVLDRVYDRWQKAGLCGGASCSNLLDSGTPTIDIFSERRTRSILYAVTRAIETLAPLQGRKSVLLFSPGFDEDAANWSMVRKVVAASRYANAAVYFLDVRGLMGSPSFAADAPLQAPDQASRMAFDDRVLSSAGAQTLAYDTGGLTVRNTNDLAAAASRIEGESRAFYLLGFYAPEGKRPGAWRKLRVQVQDGELEVRARRGYTVARAAAKK
jgi:VWFA-related protein